MKHCTEAHCNFALESFKLQVRENPGKNVASSPISVAIALGMLMLGSGKTTADVIRRALHFWKWPESVTPTDEHDSGTQCDKHGGFHSWLKQLLTILMQHSKYHMLQIGSRIYGSKSEDFLAQYIECVKELYNSDLERVDFRNPDECRQKINSWVERQTNGDMKNLFPPHSLDQSTIMVLLNAISFQGIWKFPFNPRDTRTGVFWTCEGQSIHVDMMTQRGRYKVTKISNPGIQVVQLPCADDTFSMYILLPEGPQSTDEVITTLTVEKVQQSTDPANMITANIKLSMPRCKLEGKNSLNSMLSEMGLKNLFTQGKADLSGMIRNSQAFVSQIAQAVKMTLSEEGVEASGVSRIEIVDGTYRDIKMNRDFIFMVKHTETGCIIFWGRICAPK